VSDAEKPDKTYDVRFGVVFAAHDQPQSRAQTTGYFLVMSSKDLIAVHIMPFDSIPKPDVSLRLSDEGIWVAVFRDEKHIFMLQSSQRYKYKDDLPDSHSSAARFAITLGASSWAGWAKAVGISAPKEPLIPYPLHAVGVA
jgi:hypothetical protein